MKNKMLNKTSWVLVLCGAAISCSVLAADKVINVDLDTLYKSYLKSGRSADEMPQFQKLVKFSGVVIEQKESMSGGTIISVGTKKQHSELARMTGASDQDDEKLKALDVDSVFQATCQVTFSMGTSYMSLQRCSLQ